MRKVNEKINFNTIDIDGRINNFMNNYMSLKKNQEMDYMSFDTDVSTKNNKGYKEWYGFTNKPAQWKISEIANSTVE